MSLFFATSFSSSSDRFIMFILERIFFFFFLYLILSAPWMGAPLMAASWMGNFYPLAFAKLP